MFIQIQIIKNYFYDFLLNNKKLKLKCHISKYFNFIKIKRYISIKIQIFFYKIIKL